MLLLHSLCLVLILFEVAWWSQSGLHSQGGRAGQPRRKTVASAFGSLEEAKAGLQLTEYLLEGVALPSGGQDGERVYLADGLTEAERSLLFVNEDDEYQLRELLPNSTQGPRHNTCAFVGNSVSLLSEERGAEIDRHQAVLRFMDGTSTKYDAFVGRKRTYLAVTRGSIEPYIPESEYDKSKRPRSKGLVIHGDVPVQDYAQLRRTHPETQAYYMSPSFEMRARGAYGEIVGRARKLGEPIGDRQKASLDSSGLPLALIPLFFLKSVCKVVFVYGFTVPVTRRDDLFGPTYYGQARSKSEHPHCGEMEYLLRAFSMEGEVELVS